MPAVAEMHAWVDESELRPTGGPHAYVLAAAVCSSEAVEDVRDVMRPLRTRGTKLHWRKVPDPRERDRIVRAVADCAEVKHLVVVRLGADGETRTRPRVMALRHLLVELDRIDVRRAVLESRGRADDRRDIDVLRQLRDGIPQRVRSALRMDHRPGPADAGLWVPDVVCGAVAADRGGDRRYLQALEETGRVHMITINHRDIDVP